MNLYIHKFNAGMFPKVKVIDYAASIIWIKRFKEAGYFELYVKADKELFKLVTEEKMIMITRDDDSSAMIVNSVKLTTSADTGDYLTISGKSAEGILGQRIFTKQANYTGTAESIIRKMITDNIIAPTDLTRKIINFTLAESHDFTENTEKQVTGKNLLDIVSEICTAFEYGFKVDYEGGQFVFDLYKGVDRSLDQNENNRVIFSPDFENLGNTEFSRDKSTYYNSVYVAGEGEGSDRVIVNLNSGFTGLFLREMWADARTTSATTEEGELTPAEYEAVLEAQAVDELAKVKELTDFSGEILAGNSYKYGIDYSLGDKVTVINEYGIRGTAVISEITEVEDETGYSIYPTLSEWKV